MKTIQLFFFFLVLCNWGYAQSRQDGKPDGKRKGKPEIKAEILGKVIDAQSGEALEYTNVTLYSSKDSSLVTGTITSKNGEFHLENIKGGRYYLIVNFIGYHNHEIPNLHLNPNNLYVDLGKIQLEMKAEVLDAFEVTSEKEGIEFKMDKKVVNVDKFYTATSGTTVDILENVPSISVDAERNVTLRGSSGFTVLVDGRPTVMDAADVLEQYPASSVESIEIITNPSAKYDPEGTAGIINIITKKQKQLGISGIANVNVGMYDNYGADALLQVKNKKLSWYVGLDYNKRGRVGQQETYNATFNSDTINIVGGDGDFKGYRSSGTVRAGADIKLSNKNFWLIEGSAQFSDRKRTNDLDYIESTNGIVLDHYNSLNEGSREATNWNLNSDYTHKFKGEDKVFSWQVSWSRSEGDEYNLNELFDIEGNYLREGQRTTEVGPNMKGQTRLNFENKIHDSLKYEIGYQGTYDASKDAFGTLNFDSLSGDYVEDESYKRNSEFYRFIHATYAVFSGSRGNWGYQFGLRSEFTNRNVKIIGDPTEYPINRVDLFPTVHFSYKLDDKGQFMGSYTRRIQRPRPWYLEPYVTARDQWNYRGGNPNLAPEYIDAIEFGYQKRVDKIFFSAEVYYRYTKDKVERINQAYTEKGPGVTIQIPENVGFDQALGLEFMLKTPVAKWWDLNLMGNFYDYRVQGSFTDIVNNTTYSFDNNSTNYTIRLNQTFKLNSRLKFQFNSSYNSPTVSAQGKRSEFFDFSSALRADVIDKKLFFNLQVRNMFATAIREHVDYGVNFESRGKLTMAGPVVTFTATYKLNNYKARSKGERGNSGNGE
ncbi:TonB-dependent receptor [bacterium SCSIO 12643]|nr:TonB-dependent receptor [bacterium SCSIO 12643]